MKTIFTLDSRDNFRLEILKSEYNLSYEELHREIQSNFDSFLSILGKKQINYGELKNALIPHKDRFEMALAFDSTKIESTWYGYEVFSKVIPLFVNKDSSHSILCGDLIGSNKHNDKLYAEFMTSIKPSHGLNFIEYYHHSQFYLVYLNNLTEKMVKDFHEGLKDFVPYVGYFDITFDSYLKMYFSTILVKSFIKHKRQIISCHEDDVSNDNDYNTTAYPFEKYGYTCRSLQLMYYDLFLSYKIERKVFDGFQIDTNLSISAVNKDVLALKDFSILIEEDKLVYLQSEKSGSLKRAGKKDITPQELESLIAEKISNNYIYNLCYLDESGTTKFNIIIEVIAEDTGQPVKLIAALEYKPSDKSLRACLEIKL
jgi:hypothetical protein